MTEPQTKTCRVCNESRNIDRFSVVRRLTRVGGEFKQYRLGKCKNCYASRGTKYTRLTPEQMQILTNDSMTYAAKCAAISVTAPTLIKYMKKARAIVDV